MAVVVRAWVAVITRCRVLSDANTLLTSRSAGAHACIVADRSVRLRGIVAYARDWIARAREMAVIGRIAGIDGTGQTHAFFAMIVDGAQISVFTQVACGRRCDATSAGITRIVRAGIPVITNLGGSDTGTRLAAVRDRADLSIIAREVFKIRWMSTHTRITDVFRADVLVVITIRRIAQ